METTIWQTYADDGLVVLGIGTEDEEAAIFAFETVTNVTFPVVFDPGSVVFDLYAQYPIFGASLFPQQFLVDPEGTIVFAQSAYDVDALKAAVEAVLAE